MIIIALGANMPSMVGEPKETLNEAIQRMTAWPEFQSVRCSNWYQTKPVGPVEQADFANGVAVVETSIAPIDLLRKLLRLEQTFGRERSERWGPRTIDLDIIDYDGWVAEVNANGLHLNLPHPRLAERPFVLLPVAEIAPDWHHPILQLTATEMLERLPDDQKEGISPLSKPKT